MAGRQKAEGREEELRQCEAWQGKARHGEARSGEARQGKARRGMAWYDLEEVKKRIAGLDPIKRAQIYWLFPHLATEKFDDEELPEVSKDLFTKPFSRG